MFLNTLDYPWCLDRDSMIAMTLSCIFPASLGTIFAGGVRRCSLQTKIFSTQTKCLHQTVTPFGAFGVPSLASSSTIREGIQCSSLRFVSPQTLSRGQHTQNLSQIRNIPQIYSPLRCHPRAGISFCIYKKNNP